MDPNAPPGSQGRSMMMRKLRLYLWWKGKLSQRKQDGKSHFRMPDADNNNGGGRANDQYVESSGLSEAMKRKDKERAARTANRRRVRGGGPTASGSESSHAIKTEGVDPVIREGEIIEEARSFADLFVLYRFVRLSTILTSFLAGHRRTTFQRHCLSI